MCVYECVRGAPCLEENIDWKFTPLYTLECQDLDVCVNVKT